MLRQRHPGERPTVALGCMNFGKRTPEPEARRIIDRALERGVTVFDTAGAYNHGESERILGRALRGKRDRVQIAGKVGFARVGGKPEGLSRATILRAVDECLTRLDTDYVDVFYLHVPDHTVPIEESLAAMEEIREAGKIRAIGVSNYAAWQILEMTHLGVRPTVSQVMYNLLIRQIDIEYASFTRRYPIHTTVFNPLAGGLLSGKHVRTGEPPSGSRFEKNKLYLGRYWSDRFFDVVEDYRALAAELGVSLVELSYAWLAGREVVDSIITGPGSVEHLDAAIDGCVLSLPPGAGERIDAVYRAFSGTDASYVR